MSTRPNATALAAEMAIDDESDWETIRSGDIPSPSTPNSGVARSGCSSPIPQIPGIADFKAAKNRVQNWIFSRHPSTVPRLFRIVTMADGVHHGSTIPSSVLDTASGAGTSSSGGSSWNSADVGGKRRPGPPEDNDDNDANPNKRPRASLDNSWTLPHLLRFACPFQKLGRQNLGDLHCSMPTRLNPRGGHENFSRVRQVTLLSLRLVRSSIHSPLTDVGVDLISSAATIPPFGARTAGRIAQPKRPRSNTSKKPTAPMPHAKRRS